MLGVPATVLAADGGDPMPLGASFVLGPLLIGAGLLITWIAVRGWRGELERNRAAGIRTPATLASDDAWLRAHRAAGPWMTAASLGSIVPGAIILFRPSNGTAVLLIMVGMAVMVALVAVAAFMANVAATAGAVPPDRGGSPPEAGPDAG